MKTTLNKIRQCTPCADGWAKLLRTLNKTKADDEPLLISTILNSNGLDDAVWCLGATKGCDKEIGLYAVWCARQVQHLMRDKKSIEALDVAERYANGLADKNELKIAQAAASAAANAANAAATAASKAANAANAFNSAWYAANAAANAANAANAAATANASNSAWYAANAAVNAAWAASKGALYAANAAATAALAAVLGAQEKELRRICNEYEAVKLIMNGDYCHPKEE